MITELLLNGVFAVANFFLDKVPVIEWTVDTSAYSYISDVLSMIAYLLPMNTIRQIVAMILAISFFRIFIALWRAVLGLIPFA